jgi:hypothetical protein
MPIRWRVLPTGLELTFSDRLDLEPGAVPRDVTFKAWDLKRSASYGSPHLNERLLRVEKVEVREGGRLVRLEIPGLSAADGFELRYQFTDAGGSTSTRTVNGTIHGTTQAPRTRVGSNSSLRRMYPSTPKNAASSTSTELWLIK